MSNPKNHEPKNLYKQTQSSGNEEPSTRNHKWKNKKQQKKNIFFEYDFFRFVKNEFDLGLKEDRSENREFRSIFWCLFRTSEMAAAQGEATAPKIAWDEREGKPLSLKVRKQKKKSTEKK